MTRKLLLLASLMIAAPLFAQLIPADPPIVGRRKVAAVLVNMTNATFGPKCTKERLSEEMLRLAESPAAFFAESSFGQLELEVDVFGPVSIPMSTDDGDRFSTLTPLNEWIRAAEDQLASQGVDLTPYPYRAMIFPRVDYKPEGPRACTGAWATTWGRCATRGSAPIRPRLRRHTASRRRS